MPWWASAGRRDGDGTFEPKVASGTPGAMPGVDELGTGASAKGLTTGDFSAMLAQIQGFEVSRETVSKITDKLQAEMAETAVPTTCRRIEQPSSSLGPSKPLS